MFYWQFNRAWCIKEVQRLVRVASLGYSDGARNLEVMLESLSGGRRREIQEDGIVMEVKNFLFKCCRWRQSCAVLTRSPCFLLTDLIQPVKYPASSVLKGFRGPGRTQSSLQKIFWLNKIKQVVVVGTTFSLKAVNLQVALVVNTLTETVVTSCQTHNYFPSHGTKLYCPVTVEYEQVVQSGYIVTCKWVGWESNL